ncbi:hypothetical protein TGGT1_312850 [Toxoplasma gondii GT1]|uniref:Uncharacterized protein n=2 Tax=Toxoplasma gondii TaxID=5811 RepID=S7UTC0_TOXGG|nr:hypothetical protein TGGT1_312850 [Toxoplasma gondii GT1]KAF4639428.1 hypothetical protein TGRH88_052000 [Toxoplasma gondii]
MRTDRTPDGDSVNRKKEAAGQHRARPAAAPEGPQGSSVLRISHSQASRDERWRKKGQETTQLRQNDGSRPVRKAEVVLTATGGTRCALREYRWFLSALSAEEKGARLLPTQTVTKKDYNVESSRRKT